jgi:tetrahydromethanopterin S-methyltransferase subunit A
MKKTPVPEGYPPEEGCYLRGNDNSPVAVVVILKWDRDKTPPEIDKLVRTGLETGAALSGTLQTENVGLEKVICNIIANPNIRYFVVCGPESPGRLVGETIRELFKNGVDKTRRIIGSTAPAPYLHNIPLEWIERFRRQVTFIDLINEGNPEVIRTAVRSCYQEEPVEFKGYKLYDCGAFDGEPIIGSLLWKITSQYIPPGEKELDAVEKMHRMMAMLKERKRKKEELAGGK